MLQRSIQNILEFTGNKCDHVASRTILLELKLGNAMVCPQVEVKAGKRSCPTSKNITFATQKTWSGHIRPYLESAAPVALGVPVRSLQIEGRISVLTACQ